MIVLNAEIEVSGRNPYPFIVGKSKLGNDFFGDEVSENMEIGKHNILSLDVERLDRQDVYLPSWGVVSNGGIASFRDNGGKALAYIKIGMIKKGKKVRVFLKDTISKNKQQVGQFFVGDLNYDVYSRSVEMDLTDGLTDWQEYQIDPLVYNVEGGSPRSFKYIYNYIVGQIPSASKLRMKAFEELDFETRNFLEKGFVKFPFINSCSLWSALDMFAKATQTYIYVNENGLVECKYLGGN